MSGFKVVMGRNISATRLFLCPEVSFEELDDYVLLIQEMWLLLAALEID